VIAGLHLGDFPTWVAAVGTVGALVAALIQINTERERRHALEARDAQERHLAQARLISAFLGVEETRGRPGPAQAQPAEPQNPWAGRTAIYLVNGSDEPVYEPVVGLVAIQGAAPRRMEDWFRARESNPNLLGVPVTTASVLPPGQSRVWIQGAGWSQHLSGRSGAEVAFTDRAGSHWIRHANGRLEELATSPFDHFGSVGLTAPYELQTPERL
jgi:hypothetical protein